MEETQEDGDDDDDDDDDDDEDEDAKRESQQAVSPWHLRQVWLEGSFNLRGLVSFRASARQGTTPFRQLGLPARP